jgi:hypothetical protein
MKKITEEQAVKALEQLMEIHFGHDKGSGEMYQEWAENVGLCKSIWEEYPDGDWPSEFDNDPDYQAPSCYELLMALGISPQKLVDTLHINPKIFDQEWCDMYGFEQPN